MDVDLDLDLDVVLDGDDNVDVDAARVDARSLAAGRWSEADSAKHYEIARGEAMECAASLDVMKLRRLVATETYETGSGSSKAWSRC